MPGPDFDPMMAQAEIEDARDCSIAKRRQHLGHPQCEAKISSMNILI